MKLLTFSFDDGNEDDVRQLATEFLQSTEQTDMLFYIWGHSYELVT